MARGFLTKKEVRQIIKFSWGIGKPSDWDFEYCGKDAVYLSCNKLDCVLRICPTKTPGIVYHQLLVIQEGRLVPFYDVQGREKYTVFYHNDICYTYAGVAHGSLYDSAAYMEALERYMVA
jgi:hypothetical protein